MEEKQVSLDSELKSVLGWGVSDHQAPQGQFFSDRYADLASDVARASKLGLWQYFRTHKTNVGRSVVVQDEAGRTYSGVNGASQDYLGLSNEERVVQGAVSALNQYGAHSAGSAPMGGRTELANSVEAKLMRATGLQHICLFPTGWAAGYGIIKGMVRPFDHVVIDALGHNCLQHGAFASTQNVHQFIHNDLASLEKRLDRIRRREPRAAILIVTEALFSMDSDGPNFQALLALKKKYECMLLLDVAHDFGCLGPSGTGLLAETASYIDVDYVIGSFSKTFASIGGFMASNDLSGVRAVQGFSGSYTFSNYLIPAQLGAINAALDIVFSAEGDDLRAKLIRNTERLRSLLLSEGIQTMGLPSAMTIVLAGSEARARLAYRSILQSGIVLNCIEFPAVRRGEARFRVQLSPKHTAEEIDAIGFSISRGLADADSQIS